MFITIFKYFCPTNVLNFVRQTIELLPKNRQNIWIGLCFYCAKPNHESILPGKISSNVLADVSGRIPICESGFNLRIPNIT